MSRIRTITAVSAISAAILAAGSAFTMASFTMNGRRQTIGEAYEWQKAHYDVSWYDTLEKESYIIKSYDGYELHVMLLRSPVSADAAEDPAGVQAGAASSPACPSDGKYVIITHGYTDNRMGALKYAKIYLDRGYSCIVYDLRGHGENEKTYCTYSIRESRDLLALIEDTCARYGQDITLGLHGESLGAAATAASLGLQQRVSFAVADCPFADIENVLKGGVRAAHLPAWFVDLAGIAAKLRYGYSFREMRPIDALADNRVPILFLHGAEDNFILPSNSERMQKAAPAVSELHLIPGAGHAESVLKQPDLYEKLVDSFLKRNGLL